MLNLSPEIGLRATEIIIGMPSKTDAASGISYVLGRVRSWSNTTVHGDFDLPDEKVLFLSDTFPTGLQRFGDLLLQRSSRAV